MFAVIYKFKVKIGKESDFIDSWSALTELIYKYEGSLGSRLHKVQNSEYIAYANWPNKEKWKSMGGNLPKKASEISAKMKSCCTKIEILYELETEIDLIKQSPF